MKITFKFSINMTRDKPSVPDESDEKTPQGDVFASTERAPEHAVPELLMGFQREYY